VSWSVALESSLIAATANGKARGSPPAPPGAHGRALQRRGATGNRSPIRKLVKAGGVTLNHSEQFDRVHASFATNGGHAQGTDRRPVGQHSSVNPAKLRPSAWIRCPEPNLETSRSATLVIGNFPENLRRGASVTTVPTAERRAGREADGSSVRYR
jgi:hypothetical protein